MERKSPDRGEGRYSDGEEGFFGGRKISIDKPADVK